MSQLQDVNTIMRDLGRRARNAAAQLANAPRTAKDKALRDAAAFIREDAAALIEANAQDMEVGRSKNLTEALLDRLLLTEDRIEAMAKGLEDIAELPDPVGHVLSAWDRPNGLQIERVAVPLGVIGVIYESRPNVTADAAALCLKAGNAVILRGGSESFHSSRAIHARIAKALVGAGLPEDAVSMVPTTDRAAVGALLTLSDYVDVIVPRGGRGLIERITAESRIPLFKHLDGINHTYLHAGADAEKAVAVTVNGKMRRTSICGATETVLVDKAVASDLLPPLAAALKEKNCLLRGDETAQALVPDMAAATPEDWDTEYLDAILAVRVVEGLDEALAHIAAHSSGHTECIVTEDSAAAERFLAEVDSAIVMQNASTQFADGGEFGMGAEIGISTGRMHARGPVGVEQLTTHKYKVRGSGQVRP